MNSRFAQLLCFAALSVSLLKVAGAVCQTTPPSWSDLNPVTQLTAESFRRPPDADRPWVRVNTPENVTSEELKTEIAEMKNSGIGGLEIGQGTFPKSPQLIAILQAANQLGLKVSLSHGTTVSPAGYSLNEENVRKTLLFTAWKVSGGETADVTLSAPLPPPNMGFGGGRR